MDLYACRQVNNSCEVILLTLNSQAFDGKFKKIQKVGCFKDLIFKKKMARTIKCLNITILQYQVDILDT